MRRGHRHSEFGRLELDAGEIVLRRADGGRWRLDAPARAYDLIGREVRVLGERDGADLLVVLTLEPL